MIRGITEYVTASPEETQALGVHLAQQLSPPAVILLRGALGTGKTTLARGIALGLGLEDPSRVSSPSFTLVNTYQGRCPVYHVDLYRVEGEREIYSIGLDDFLGRIGVTIVEWSERLRFPAEAGISVELVDAGENSRIIKVRYTATARRDHANLSRRKPGGRSSRPKSAASSRRLKR